MAAADGELLWQQPAADDAEGQALLARFKGRRLPMVDRVEVSIIDKRGKRGSVRQRVFPRCAQPDTRKRAMCDCLCQQDYTLDKCKDVMNFPESPDAGACFPTESDGGTGDGGMSDGAARD